MTSRITLFVVVGLLICALTLFSSAAYGGPITVNSGGGLTYLNGPPTTDFLAPFTSANFLAAQTGTAASILSSTPFYVSGLVDGPAAVWIGTNPTAGVISGDTALYAASFSAPSSGVYALTLYYAVDNFLGLTNPGIYINGTALPSSTAIGTFNMEYVYTDNVTLTSGTNWLYIDAVNFGGPAGLIFSADFSQTSSTTPEPSSIFLLGSGLLVAAGAIKRKVLS